MLQLSKRTILLFALLCGLLTLVGVGIVFAASDVTGAWISQTALGSAALTTYCAETSTDLTQIRYGASFYTGDFAEMCAGTAFTDKSGLGFVGKSDVELICPAMGDPIVTQELGTFTHYNNPIYVDGITTDQDGRLAEAQLDISLSGDIDVTFPFDLLFEETRNPSTSYPNSDYETYNGNHALVTAQCPYPAGSSGPGDPAYDALNVNGCGDRVVFEAINSETTYFDPNGNECTLTIQGFAPCGSGGGDASNEYLTVERTQNDTCLFGALTPPSDPTAVQLTSTAADSAALGSGLMFALLVAIVGMSGILFAKQTADVRA